MIKLSYQLIFDLNKQKNTYDGVICITPSVLECIPKNIEMILIELAGATGNNCSDYFERVCVGTGEIVVKFGVDMEYQFYGKITKHSSLFKRNFVIEPSIENIIEDVISFIEQFVEAEICSLNCVSEYCLFLDKNGICLDNSNKHLKKSLKQLFREVQQHANNAQGN